MKRTSLIVSLLALLCLWPALTSAQPSLLGDVQAERAKYGAAMTPGEVAEMLNTVAWNHRAEGWGLLRKGSGNSCPLRDTFISCDILVNSRTVLHFDVLRDAENAAVPQWNNAGPCVLSDSSGCEMSRFQAPFQPRGILMPPPDPEVATAPSTSSADVDALLALLAEHDKAVTARIEAARQDSEDRAERMFADLVARLTEIKGLVQAQPAAPMPATVPSVPTLPALAADAKGGNIWAAIAKYGGAALAGYIATVTAK